MLVLLRSSQHFVLVCDQGFLGTVFLAGNTILQDGTDNIPAPCLVLGLCHVVRSFRWDHAVFFHIYFIYIYMYFVVYDE